MPGIFSSLVAFLLNLSNLTIEKTSIFVDVVHYDSFYFKMEILTRVSYDTTWTIVALIADFVSRYISKIFNKSVENVNFDK